MRECNKRCENLFYALDGQLLHHSGRAILGTQSFTFRLSSQNKFNLSKAGSFQASSLGLYSKKINKNTEAISESSQMRNHLILLCKNVFLTCNNKSNYNIPNISCNAFVWKPMYFLKLLSIRMLLFQGCQLMHKIGFLENS